MLVIAASIGTAAISWSVHADALQLTLSYQSFPESCVRRSLEKPFNGFASSRTRQTSLPTRRVSLIRTLAFRLFQFIAVQIITGPVRRRLGHSNAPWL